MDQTTEKEDNIEAIIITGKKILKHNWKAQIIVKLVSAKIRVWVKMNNNNNSIKKVLRKIEML